MNYKNILILLALSLFIISCGGKTGNKKQEPHSHNHENCTHEHGEHQHGDHKHEGHSHAEGEHNHENCTHEHEGHSHDHSGHNHGENDGHDHAELADGETVFPAEQARRIGMKKEVIKPASFNSIIKTSGQIVPAIDDETIITASTSGRVTFKNSQTAVGSAIGKQEHLITISSGSFENGDPIQRARIAFEIAENDYERAQKLRAEKLISVKNYNEIKHTYESARLAFQQFANQKGSEGAEIKSPIKGYIKDIFVQEGSFVNMGDPVISVSSNTKMRLKADVSQRDFGKIKDINSANFKTSYSDNIFNIANMGGKVLSFGKTTAANDFFLPLYFEFTATPDILSGAYVDVYLLGKEKKTLSVPVTSLIEEQGLFFVYVALGNDHYMKTEVKTGDSNGERIEIVFGLKSGDTVVTHGAYHLKLASASAAIPHGHVH